MKMLDTNIKELLAYQNDLDVIYEKDGNVSLEGKIFVNMVHDHFPVQRYYDIKIIVNPESVYLSDVYETGGYIGNYCHKYKDNRLCLATNIDLVISNADNNSQVNFCREYIEQYFFIYEYYTTYGFFPYGDRAHDLEGVKSSYKEITGIKDDLDLARFLLQICRKEYHYRGHLPCPCGSGKQTRKCHPKILKLMTDELVYKQICIDFLGMVKEFDEHKRKAK